MNFKPRNTTISISSFFLLQNFEDEMRPKLKMLRQEKRQTRITAAPAQRAYTQLATRNADLVREYSHSQGRETLVLTHWTHFLFHLIFFDFGLPIPCLTLSVCCVIMFNPPFFVFVFFLFFFTLLPFRPRTLIFCLCLTFFCSFHLCCF